MRKLSYAVAALIAIGGSARKMRRLIITAIAASTLSAGPCLAGQNIWTFDGHPNECSFSITDDIGREVVVNADVQWPPALLLYYKPWFQHLQEGRNYRVSVVGTPTIVPSLYLSALPFPATPGIGVSLDGKLADQLAEMMGSLMGSSDTLTFYFPDGISQPWVMPTTGLNAANSAFASCLSKTQWSKQ